jgi:hypothetical protein
MATIELNSPIFGRTTLEAALARAKAGDVIILDPDFACPGRITLRAPVTLRARKDRAVSIGATVEIASEVTLDGFDICSPSGNAVVVTNGGRATLTNCVLRTTLADWAAVAVGADSSVEIRDCTIRDTPSNAVWVCQGGRAEIVRCQLRGLKHAAVCVAGRGSSARIRESNIYGTKGAGIWVREQAQVVIEACDISACGDLQGVLAEGGATASAHQSKIHDMQGPAVEARTGGQVLLDHCELSEIETPAVNAVGNGSVATLNDTIIHDVRLNGVFASEGARVVADKCDIRGCGPGRPAVALLTGASGRLSRCTVHDITSNAVVCRTAAQAELLDCQIYDIQAPSSPALFVGDPGSTIKAVGAHIHHVKSCGAYASGRAALVIDDSELSACGDGTATVVVESGARGTFGNVKIHDSINGIGLRVNGAHADLTRCELRSLKSVGLDCGGAECRVTAQDCDIHGTVKNSVAIHDQARVTLKRSRLTSAGEKYPAINVDSGAEAQIMECEIRETPSFGIQVDSAARVEIVGTKFSATRGAVSGGGTGTVVTISDVTVSNTREGGLWIERKARMTLERSELTSCGAKEPAIGVSSECEATITRCKIHDTGEGLLVQRAGRAEMIESEVYDCGGSGVRVVGLASRAVLTECTLAEQRGPSVSARQQGRVVLQRCRFPRAAGLSDAVARDPDADVSETSCVFGAGQTTPGAAGSTASAAPSEEDLLRSIEKSLWSLTGLERLKPLLAMDICEFLSARQSLGRIFWGDSGVGKTEVAQRLSGLREGYPGLSLGGGQVRYVSGVDGRLEVKEIVDDLPPRSILFVDEADKCLDPNTGMVTAAEATQIRHAIVTHFQRKPILWVFLGVFAQTRVNGGLTDDALRSSLGDELAHRLDYADWRFPSWTLESLLKAVNGTSSRRRRTYDDDAALMLAQYCIKTGGGVRAFDNLETAIIRQERIAGIAAATNVSVAVAREILARRGVA